MSFIAEKLMGKNYSCSKYDCPEENKAPEKEDGKEEKETEKNSGKEYAAEHFIFASTNSVLISQIELYQHNSLAGSSSGFSGEIFSPPEAV